MQALIYLSFDEVPTNQVRDFLLLLFTRQDFDNLFDV